MWSEVGPVHSVIGRAEESSSRHRAENNCVPGVHFYHAECFPFWERAQRMPGLAGIPRGVDASSGSRKQVLGIPTQRENTERNLTLCHSPYSANLVKRPVDPTVERAVAAAVGADHNHIVKRDKA